MKVQAKDIILQTKETRRGCYTAAELAHFCVAAGWICSLHSALLVIAALSSGWACWQGQLRKGQLQKVIACTTRGQALATTTELEADQLIF